MEFRLLREQYQDAVRFIADSFIKNPGRCPVRARVFQILKKEHGALDDQKFIQLHCPGVAGAQILAAARDLNGRAVTIYRIGAALASGART